MDDYGLDLVSFDAYKASSVKLIRSKLEKFYSEKKKKFSDITISEIKADINAINSFPGISHMKEVHHDEIIYIDDNADTKHAEKAILDGKIFFEHAAAGEATRLGIGTKYLIKPGDLDFKRIREILVKEARSDNKPESEIHKINAIKDETLHKECGNYPKELIQLSIGTRHMIQLIFDIRKLAVKHGVDPDSAIKKQKMIIILNEASSKHISEEIFKHAFFSLDPENMYFMEQKSFHGITKDGEKLFYDETDNHGKEKNNRRLHNHGQMVMQKLHDKSIFRFLGNSKDLVKNSKSYVSRKEFLSMLESCDDMISYNIEDLGYLTSSLDLKSLATALKMKKEGFKMVMEVVGQNPSKPQKGGSLFKDPSTSKNYMIESFRLADMKPEQMKLMNKNFNHYPDPSYALKKVAEKGLMLGFEVKTASDGKEYIYLCPVQGDTNFIVPTAFVTRKILKPIYNWKSASQTTQAIRAMHDQEIQDGWKEFAKSLKLL